MWHGFLSDRLKHIVHRWTLSLEVFQRIRELEDLVGRCPQQMVGQPLRGFGPMPGRRESSLTTRTIGSGPVLVPHSLSY